MLLSTPVTQHAQQGNEPTIMPLSVDTQNAVSCYALYSTNEVKVIIDGAATSHTVPSADLFIPGTIENADHHVTRETVLVV
jgi:predicted ribosome-associated RNA-binding protein Tma20